MATAGMTILGLRMGLAVPHMEYPANVAYWMEFWVWIYVLIQSIALNVPSSSTGHFAVSWRIGASSLVALLICLAQIYAAHSGHVGKVYITLGGAQAAIAVTIGLLSSMIPRLPDVFHNGIMVDRQFTTNLLGRVTFSWVEPVLCKSEHSKHVVIEDLPERDNSTKGETVYRTWEIIATKSSFSASWDLWWSTLQSHGRAFLCQMMITILLSFLSFGPQISLWQILKLLEARDSGQNSDMLWDPVRGLGLSVMGSATLGAIIRPSKTLVSSVDNSTVDLLQRSLCSALGRYQTTFLVIAHRLKTIADSDMVLVMDDGMIVESGSPKELLHRDQSCFRSMVYQDPEREMLENIILNGVK